MKKAYALFDFDGTIARGDSIIPFIFYCVKKRFASPGILFNCLGVYSLYYLHLKDDTWAKERTMAFLKGKTASQVDELAFSFYRDELSRRLFPKAVREIGKCREAGMEVLVVSASPDAYLKQTLPPMLGVKAVIATRCGLDDNQVYTGQFASQNCRGFEKTLRIAEYLAAQGEELDPEASRSYGDSLGDVPMLTLTHHPVAVNAKSKLTAQVPDARRESWTL